MSALLNAALYYAKQGWYVFPLAPTSKSPLAGSHALDDATLDEAKIRAWWEKTPNANVAVNCGKSGLVVLDVDTNPRKGKVGGNSLFALIGEDFSLLDTVNSHTWSNGSHYFYRGECESSQSKLGKHLDIKGKGGYVVLPPSAINEDGITGWYRWEKGDGEKYPIAPFPEIFRPKAPKGQEPTLVRDVVQIAEGSRNAELTRRAGLYRRIGMGPSAIDAALRVDNQTMCSKPLPDKEIAAIARSVGRYAPDPKASAPPPPSLALANGGELMSDEDFLQKVEIEVNWQIEGFVQRSGIILLSALPKVGKSELARCMAKAVATGGDFLGRHTKRGKVLWIGLAEPESTLRKAQETMSLLGLGITWVTSRPSGLWQPWLAEAVEKTRADFVVVDEIGRLATDMESINDYSQVVRATQPFIDLRSRFGTTFCLLHHNNKQGGTSGSTAWEGAVDCIMSLSRTQDNVRTIQTKQRLGEDLESTVLARDPNTGLISAPMSKALADQRQAEQGILDALSPGRQLTRQALADLNSRGSHVGRSAVDALLAAGLIEAVGSGKRGDPKFYQRAGSLALAIPLPPEESLPLLRIPRVPRGGLYIPEPPEETKGSGSGFTRTLPEAPEENPSHPTVPEPPEETVLPRSGLNGAVAHEHFRLRAYGEE